MALTIVGNGLNLVVPKLISHAIDAYTQGRFVLNTVVLQFVVVGLLVFAFYLRAEHRADLGLRTRGEGSAYAPCGEDLRAVVRLGGETHARPNS